MSLNLSEEESRFFRKNGYIGPFDLYERDEIIDKYKVIRSEMFDRSFAAYDLDNTSVISGYDRHLDIDILSRHIMEPAIVKKVNSMLGPDVICWRTEMFPKYPGDEGTDWHQADTFAHASGEPQIVWPEPKNFGGAITVWTALTDSIEENGCLRFIPGTHEEMHYDESKEMEYNPDKRNVLEKNGVRRGFFGYDYRNLQKDKNWKPDEDKAVSIEMKAGQFVIFWSTLMHSSLPNKTKDQTRLGFTSRYVPSFVHIYPNVDKSDEFGSELSLDRYGVVFVSGDQSYTHNRVLKENHRGFRFSSGENGMSQQERNRLMPPKLETNIAQLFQEILGDEYPKVSSVTKLEELNIRSMQSVLIVSHIEEKFNIEFPMQEYYSLVTFGELITYVNDQLPYK